jgi:restriction endonuclease Mrr
MEAQRHSKAARQRHASYEDDPVRVAPLNALLDLDADNFEQAVGALLEFLGYTDITLMNARGEVRAIDLYCLDQAGKKTAVRCRQYDRDAPVEFTEVVQFVDATRAQNVEHHVFVTTSYYSDHALEFGHMLSVTMMSGSELATRMLQFRASVEK